MTARLCLSLLLLAALPSAQAASEPPLTAVDPGVATLLAQVPDDVHMLVIVPNVARLTAGVTAFGRAASIEDLCAVSATQVLADTLGDSARAIRADGPAILAFSARRDEPLLLATVSKENDWRTDSSSRQLSDEVLLHEFGADQHVVAQRGDVVLIGRDVPELRRALDAPGRLGAKVSEALRSTSGQGDVSVYIDVTGWHDEFNMRMAVLRQTMYMGMAAAGPDAEAGMVVWNWILDSVRRAASDARVLTAHLRVDGRGVFVESEVTFAPDSTLGKYLAQARRSERDLLRGLPAGDAPIIVAYEWQDEPGTVGCNLALNRAMLGTDAVREKLGDERVKTVLARSEQICQKVPGANGCFGVSPAGDGLMYWGLYLTTDCAAVRDDMRALCDATPELMSCWGTFPSTAMKRVKEEVAGVQADAYRFDFTDDDSAMAQQMRPVMEAVYGKQPTLYLAPHREGISFAFGPDTAARAKLTEILQDTSQALKDSPRVCKVQEALAAHPQACVLADVPALVRTLSVMMNRLGVPGLPALKEVTSADLPLVGVGVYFDGPKLRVCSWVPVEPVAALVDIGRRIDAEEAK